MDAKALREQADDLFSKRSTLTLLWQELADNFYVERADFTIRRTIGTDYAAGLMTSYPPLCRRDLGDQIGSMLRPTNKAWSHMTTKDERRETHEAKVWLAQADTAMRRAMYDPAAQFTRATKEGDHDFSTFGQCALSIELNRHANALLYRCWHLRDVAWMENQEGVICMVARRWKPGAKDLARLFPGKLDKKITDKAAKKPFEEVPVLHMVVEAELYDDKANGKPYWSIYYDCDNDKIIEATAVYSKIYVIPRWQTVSGSQYAFSPATVIALPEARLLQAMTLTLLEAGEKAVNPPVIATTNVVKSDIELFAGGRTWVDEDYDEKLGEALRPLAQDLRGLPLSQEMRMDTRGILQSCFYLNKLRPFTPTTDPQMTAFQAGQIVADYIRQALPLFEPMEMEYNGAVCKETFMLMNRNRAFGSVLDRPKILRNLEEDIQFQFESPLHDAIKAQKGHKLLEMSQMIAQAMALDKSVANLPDAKVALRDALDGIGVPPKWVRSETQVKEMDEMQAEQQQTQQLLTEMGQGAVIAKDLGQAQAAAGATAPAMG